MSTETEEDDYMSDKFVDNCVNLRPGLVSKATSRQYHVEKATKQANRQNQLKRKNMKESEKERRTEGLSIKLSEDNKGFALLQKMGYKPGMSLGKEGQGRSEPVPIKVKCNREGLGLATKRKEQLAEINKFQEMVKRKNQKLQGNFMQRMSDKFSVKEIEKDLEKSQKVCDELDGRAKITEPKDWFYWPLYRLEQKLADESEDEAEEKPILDIYTPEEKLEMVIDYLRNTYFYCLWCGATFDSIKDIDENCPGNCRSAHESM
ncbi:G patch domain-containing protein 11 isoform X1 [Octopus bimaculoides]|uniref:G patch domain-containing protein 11 n=1 Tax=Octopus bimaculoides TaxID=37653 RepID=A0A0L8GLR4_OCTBM|nr:G patch domain-containing protein 11 isoform X1 [Octopus bimaculoides]|eukprot:XP_014779973.1 PREDICTED: G patch domain-containing protein 11-like [Octopus bimaculoides]